MIGHPKPSSTGPAPVRRRPGFSMRLWWLPAIALAGCAVDKPYAFLDGERHNRVELNTYDTQIVSVDGKYYLQNSRVLIEPGKHHIVLQTRPPFGFSIPPEKALDLDVEPCTRYWFEAKRVNALTQDFEPRVNYKEPISGCPSASPGG